MEPEQQRIAIAEICGTHSVVWSADYATLIDKNGRESDYWWSQFEGLPKGFAADPDFVYPLSYLTDLNAIAKAEKTLTEEQGMRFVRELYGVFARTYEAFEHAAGEPVLTTWFLMGATAAQRSEAFLRALGRWKE